MEKLKILSLFSGIGCWDYGLGLTGAFETVAFCEIDENCRKILKKHWPGRPIFDDIHNLHFDPDVKHSIDVITCSSPCQDFSTAGKMKGLVDEAGNPTRSGLWFEAKRIISEVKPKYVLFENVRNVLNLGMKTILRDLDSINYDCEWQIISAHAMGAPHLRERIWIIAWRRNETTESGDNDKRNYYDIRRGCSAVSTREAQDRITNTTKYERNTGTMGKEEQEWRNWQYESNGDNDGALYETAYSNCFRLKWPTPAEEEESFRGPKTAASKCHWWKTFAQPDGVDAGPPTGVDPRTYERERKVRIKQCGNGLVATIPYLIGQSILDYELKKQGPEQ